MCSVPILGRQSTNSIGLELKRPRVGPWLCVFPEREGGQVTGGTIEFWSVLSLAHVRARRTTASGGSVPPEVALPAHCRGRWVWEGRRPFPPFPPRPPWPAQPAVWQTFLGLLIDIQEWNSSRLRPSAGRHSGPLPGSSAPSERAITPSPSREHPRPRHPHWTVGETEAWSGDPAQLQHTHKSGGMGGGVS